MGHVRMSKLKKYEPAGGVVQLDWRKGAPDRNDSPNLVLAEVWQASLSMWNNAHVDVRAEIVPLKWDYATSTWVRMDGTSMPSQWRHRRWAPLWSTTTSVTVTVGDWG